MSDSDDAGEMRLSPLSIASSTKKVVHYVEVAAGVIFALLFAVGVFDLSLQILEATVDGSITQPTVVMGFIDTGLLLLIIAEIYQTVIAYIEESDTRVIVRLIIYTGVIAMVRKAIIFRTSEYASTYDALLAAVAYSIILASMGFLLVIQNRETVTET
ncbi:MAG: phosphate-starvation-inducible PsiE family protein [Halobacteria archaeon]|nr:phosphate-starvation-inducible PsiE family protein [Halobacteria archaeon]